MPGRGLPPKDKERRARRNKDPHVSTVLEFIPGEQPVLPLLSDADGNILDWHPQTRIWWKMWADSAQSDTFTDTDWSFLVDTALIHHRFWHGDMKQAAELRLRVAKFGVTPEDRARLRMVFADADEKDAKRGTTSGAAPAGSRYGTLRAVDPSGA